MNFAKLIWQRKFTVIVFTSVGAVGWLLLTQRPPLYKSTTSLTTEPFEIYTKIPDAVPNEISIYLYDRIVENFDDAITENLRYRFEVSNIVMVEDRITAFDFSTLNRGDGANAESMNSVLLERIEKSQSKIRVLSHCCQRTEILAPKYFVVFAFGAGLGFFVGVLFVFITRKSP